MKIVCSILFLITSITSYTQTFSQDYYEKFKDLWENDMNDSIKGGLNPKIDSLCQATTGSGFWDYESEALKQSTLNQIENYKSIFKLKKLNIDEQEKFVLVEEKSLGGDLLSSQIKNGVVFIDDTFFGYSYNPNDEIPFVKKFS